MANITITAASVVPPTSGTTYLPGKLAGESISAGDWLYIKDADGKAWKASGQNAAESTVVGMAATTSAAGQPVSIIQKVTGLAVGSVVSAGVQYFISSTAHGKMFLLTDYATNVNPNNVCQAASDSTITFDHTTPKTPTQWPN